MFTGIISDIGTILSREQKGDVRFVVSTHYDTNSIVLGASIAHNGVCLTVTEKDKNWFAVETSQETLDCTTAKDWQPGTRLNLERALKMGDELGGHLVSGHVDGIGTVAGFEAEGDSMRLQICVPSDLQRFMADKGSVVIDGASLTVNAVKDDLIEINLVRHTLEHTIFNDLKVGNQVNLEVDLIARYLHRLLNNR